MTKFEVGKTYGNLITIMANTGKTVKAYRTADKGRGGSFWTYDGEGEHRYKIYTDGDGDEYTIIDRFRATNYQVWGTKLSSNPSKAIEQVYISG